MLYAFGSNGSGQLGVGHDEDLSAPQKISIDTDLPENWKVEQLAAGGNHTIILCDQGKLIATGNNEDGRCGVKDRKQTNQFVTIEHPRERNGERAEIQQVSATWSATFLLSANGTVFVCGSGSSGELGLGDEVASAPNLQQIPAFPPQGTHVVHLTSSMAHTVAVLSDGSVYGWGKGRKEQIGDPAQDSWSPRCIAGIPFKAVKAACGKDFTIIVGDSTSGQGILLGPAGKDRFGLRSSAPETFADWTMIAASWGSVFVQHTNGQVSAWGRDDHGQLPPRDLPRVQMIAAGSEHALALSEAGNVLAWGWGEHGNCGEPTVHGDVKSRWNEIVAAQATRKVYAGCATSFIETDD